jgi:D-alanyl-D-alanine carboxypeptidase
LDAHKEHESFVEDEALAAALKAHPKLDFTPGEKCSYSNLSCWLLGKVIERVSGTTYDDYLRNEILDP